jgi:hypothetical protein
MRFNYLNQYKLSVVKQCDQTSSSAKKIVERRYIFRLCRSRKQALWIARTRTAEVDAERLSAKILRTFPDFATLKNEAKKSKRPRYA